MKKTWLYCIAGIVLGITLLIIIFGGIYFEYEDLEDVGTFVSPLIGGVLGGIITLIGIELSRAHSEQLQEKSRMQEVCPYFVLEVVETIYEGDFDSRFPWGGDPSPSDCLEIFIYGGPDDAEKPFRVFLLAKLHNIGYGIGRNIRIHEPEENMYYISYVAEKSYDFHKIYFAITCDPSDSIEESIFLKFEDYLGREYKQEIKIEIALYDQMIYRSEMISGRPELCTANEQG